MLLTSLRSPNAPLTRVNQVNTYLSRCWPARTGHSGGRRAEGTGMAGDNEPGAVTEDTPFNPADDCYHPPTTDDPYLVETTWWSLNIPERKLGAWLHCQYHVNLQACTWRVFAWDDTSSDPDTLAYFKMVEKAPMPANPDLRDIRFPGGGFSVRMIDPLMNYRIGYEDPDRRFAIDIEHRSVHEPHRFTPGQPPMMHSPHLDQLGHVTGTLTLHGERIPVDCYSIRDRTWGPRGGHHSSSRKPEYLRGEHRVLHPGGPTWREIERQRGRGRIQYIFGHADATTGILSFARPQDGDADGWSPLYVGWLLKDGVFGRIDADRSRMRVYRDVTTGLTAFIEAEVCDRDGRKMRAEGSAVSRIAEKHGGGHSLIRWEFDGHIGWGEDQDVWRPDHFADLRAALAEVR